MDEVLGPTLAAGSMLGPFLSREDGTNGADGVEACLVAIECVLMVCAASQNAKEIMS